MKFDTDAELRELTALTTTSTKEEILKKASEVKAHLYETWLALGVAVNLIDSLVAVFAPDSEWQKGLITSSSSTTPRVTSPSHNLRATSNAVFKIAEEIALKSGVVTNKQIAKKLRAEGDQRPESHIMTSVGNLLIKSGAWRKVRTGEYILIGKEDAKEGQKTLIN